MAHQRRFEANTLAEVLAKVQKEIGPDAKISSAQKARSGGVLGFFQREKFEVIVEIPDAADIAAAQPAPRPAEPSFEKNSQIKNEEPFTPASLLELAEEISKEERRSEAAELPVTPTAPAPPAERPKVVKPIRPEPILQVESDFKEEEPVVTTPRVDVSPRHVTKPEITEPTAKKISTETNSFAEVLSRVAFQADMKDDPKVKEGAQVINLDPSIADESAIDDRPSYLDVRPPIGSHAPAPRVVPPFRTRASDHPLATLGLPIAFIPSVDEPAPLEEALTTSLERLPKPPIIRPSKGSIITVVGELVEALELAEDLAHKWKRPAEEIVLASQAYKGKGAQTVIRNVRDAEDAQRSWSRRPRPTIVVIDAFPGSRDIKWAEHILTALEPIATYGVADATRKAEDIIDWAAQLGGVDILSVNHVEETVSPASVLATGIPVERIDGRLATASHWAALLTERLIPA